MTKGVTGRSFKDCKNIVDQSGYVASEMSTRARLYDKMNGVSYEDGGAEYNYELEENPRKALKPSKFEEQMYEDFINLKPDEMKKFSKFKEYRDFRIQQIQTQLFQKDQDKNNNN